MSTITKNLCNITYQQELRADSAQSVKLEYFGLKPGIKSGCQLNQMGHRTGQDALYLAFLGGRHDSHRDLQESHDYGYSHFEGLGMFYMLRTLSMGSIKNYV